jgi:hypothetical protein
MKRTVPVIAALSLTAAVSAHADRPTFGNSTNGDSGFELSVYNGQSMYGAAVGFTPTQNMTVSSVTLWLAGYNGNNGETIDVNIWDSNPPGSSSENPGNATNFPWAPLLYLTAAAPNDGAAAEFSFDNSNPDSSASTLLADTEYWLVVTAQGQPGCNTDSTWVGGGPLNGGANYYGSESYYAYGDPYPSFNSSSTLPAFSINSLSSVPEPGFGSFLVLPVLLGIARKFYRQRKVVEPQQIKIR